MTPPAGNPARMLAMDDWQLKWCIRYRLLHAAGMHDSERWHTCYKSCFNDVFVTCLAHTTGVKEYCVFSSGNTTS